MSATGKTQRARWWPVGLLVLLLFAATYRIAFQTPLPIVNEARAGQIEAVAQTEKSDTVIRGMVVDQQGQTYCRGQIVV